MEYFQPRQKSTHSNLPFISRPPVEQEFLAFVSERDGFEALVHHDVTEAISREAFKALPNETIGLLAGRVLRDERGPYTLVLAAHGARADEIEATPSHVRISANGHAQVRSRLEASAYGLDIIGWYHSHPRYPARFSPVDVTEQSTWRDPNHLGIVISGNDQAEPLGVYRGPQAMLLTSHVAILPPPPPPPTLPRSSYDYSEAVIVPPRARPSETALAMPPVTESQPTTAEAGSGPIARLFPWVLVLGLLSVVLSLVWLNRRMNRIEGTLSNSRYDAGPAPTVAPTPLVPPPSIEKSLFDPTISSPKPDSADTPATKPLLTSPKPTPARGSKATNRKKSRLKSGGAGSDSGTKRSPAIKPNVSAQTNSNKLGVVPAQKSQSPPQAPAERPAKP